MDFKTLRMIEDATASLRRRFPDAAMIVVAFNYCTFNSGINDPFWQVDVRFTNRPNLEATGQSLPRLVFQVTGMTPVSMAQDLAEIAASAINRVHKPANN
jgi:hypothetical protein